LVSVPPEFWGSVRLIFHPSVRVFDVATPVAVVRPALLDDDAASVDRSVRKRGTIMTWRFGLDLKCREISALEAKAQRLMAEGNTFAEMCECIASMQPEHAAETAAQYLKGWLDWGAIGSLSHAATASS